MRLVGDVKVLLNGRLILCHWVTLLSGFACQLKSCFILCNSAHDGRPLKDSERKSDVGDFPFGNARSGSVGRNSVPVFAELWAGGHCSR